MNEGIIYSTPSGARVLVTDETMVLHSSCCSTSIQLSRDENFWVCDNCQATVTVYDETPACAYLEDERGLATFAENFLTTGDEPLMLTLTVAELCCEVADASAFIRSNLEALEVMYWIDSL